MEKKEIELQKGYIADSVEVSSTSPVSLDVVDTLGRPADIGWIASDDGQIFVQINGKAKLKITLELDDVFTFEKEDLWIIKTIDITTDSGTALTVRYFFRSA